MKKNRKGFVILGLIALCLVLTAGLFTLGQSPKAEDSAHNTGEPASDVTPDGISDAGTGISGVEPSAEPTDTTTDAPDITPSGIIPQDSTDKGQTDGNIDLTDIAEKSDPPDLPDTAPADESTDGDATPEDVEEHEALPPEIKNPDVKPDITPPPVEPDKPKDTAPNAGDKDGSGNVYIPGFGWVKDEGGGGQGQQSGSDGDWDKIIGH